MAPGAFREFARSFSEPLLLLARSGEVLAANDSFYHLIGRSSTDKLNLVDLAADRPAARNYLARCARTRQFLLGAMVLSAPAGCIEVRIEGAGLPPEAPSAPAHLLLRLRLRGEAGSGFALLTRKVEELAREVRQRRQGQEEIRRINAELEYRVEDRTQQLTAANKELDAFTYTISHDLRSPLRSITGYAEILIEEFGADLPEEARRCLHRMRYNAQRMGNLIDDLLNFSRLGQHALKRETTDVGLLVQEVWEGLLLERQGRHIEFCVDEMPPLHGDRALLGQVYVNLLSNALKFTRERTRARIEVGAVSEGAAVTYFVRDNGVGFDMKYAQKLFGVFERLHLDAKYEGTGVGLAIMQRIILRHGGRIWAEAEVDRGATFFFTLGEASSAAEPSASRDGK